MEVLHIVVDKSGYILLLVRGTSIRRPLSHFAALLWCLLCQLVFYFVFLSVFLSQYQKVQFVVCLGVVTLQSVYFSSSSLSSCIKCYFQCKCVEEIGKKALSSFFLRNNFGLLLPLI